ncbi:MAG: cyclase family protein [Gammaproteobacteria bacterium]|nr:cyclase family protein [Solirubrobacterales bacterium]MBV8341999.1 cyclase family protein [Gammaproteobacteria bacterium]
MNPHALTDQAVDLFDEYIAKYSNWGKWGDADQAGTANHITAHHVRDAARLVRAGQVISLAMNFDQTGPQTGANGRFNCLRYSVATGTDHVTGAQRWAGKPLPRKMGYADDTVVLHLQSATHWDSLAHIFHDGRAYNGLPANEVSSGGAPRLGSEHLKDRLVGRGVLLDLPRAKGREWLEDGYAITVDDLESTAESERVKIRDGDILLVRTGQMARCRQQGWGTYAGGDAPGLSFFTIPWLAERQVAAVASDTWGVEVRPNELADSFQPLHIPAIVYMGLLLGEMFELEQLAAQCADDGIYEMFVSAPPLPFTGTAGAPPGPVAIR